MRWVEGGSIDGQERGRVGGAKTRDAQGEPGSSQTGIVGKYPKPGIVATAPRRG